jgi:branched-chain amino acid transport system permease protein
MSPIIVFLATVLGVVGIYSIMTMALNLSNGQTGIVDFGVVAWVMIGAYAYALCTGDDPHNVPGTSYLIGLELPMWVGVLGAMLVAGLFAFLIGLPTLRLRGDYLAIASYAFSMVAIAIFTNEAWLTNGVRGFYGLHQPFRSDFTPTGYTFFFLGLVWAFVLIVYLVLTRLRRSPFGRTLRAIREDEEVAEVIGKDLWKFRMTAYVISAMISGLAGAIYCWYATLLVPDMFSEAMTFTVWIALILGGMGNFKGAILGAAVLLGAQEATRFFQASADMAQLLAASRYMAIGMLMVVIIRFKRRGLLPEKIAQM